MAIQLSPAVSVKEIDLTNVVPAVATSIGAAVIEAGWGPVMDVTTIDSENVMVQRFGKPNDLNATNWFAAANFLSYSNNLKVVRSDTTSQRNAVATLTGSISEVPVVVAGSGYVATSTEVVIAPPVAAGGVQTVSVLTAGSNYDHAPTVKLSAPNDADGVQATAVAALVSLPGGGLAVGNIWITEPGSGYIAAPTITIGAGGTTSGFANLGDPANVAAVPGLATITGGQITAIARTSGGANYIAAPTVTISASPTGDTATAQAVVVGGEVTGFTMTHFGSGYTAQPLITIGSIGTDGFLIPADPLNVPATAGGATLTLGGVQATGTAVVINGGVASIEISNPGSGYVRQQYGYFNDHPAVAINGGNSDAVAGVAVILNGGLKINNAVQYEQSYANGEAFVGEFSAKYPGTLGNSLKVSMADAKSFLNWEYKSYFQTAPSTSGWAAQNGALNDEIHVVVIDKDGRWTGTAGTLLESYAYLSKASDGRKEDGSGAYYKTVINNNSQYVWWMDHPVIAVGYVSRAIVVNGGTGYTNGAAAVFSEAPFPGTTATGTVTVVGGIIRAINIINAGSGYTTAPTITVAGGTNATFTTAIETGAWGTPASNAVYTSLANPLTCNLSGGADHFSATTGQRINAFDLFSNDEELDINLIIAGKANPTVANWVIQSLAEVRKDCIAFVSPENKTTGDILVGNTSDITEKIIEYRNMLPSSSYYVIDTGFKYQYDRYNDKYRWVPLNGDIAGLCARTDATNDPWFSPAGLNRGQIKNVVKLAFSPRKTDRDTLYNNGINPVVAFPGQGVVLYGDKTGLSKPSAFDRINVRRLFIVLQKAISTAAKYQLFELNDVQTRAQFRSTIEPFLRDVKGRRGVYDFKVVCDESNNTPEVIDTNRFTASIFIQPSRSINFIELSFVAVRTGVSFQEVAGAA